jgi:large subunit ribosomal protein L5
MKPQTNTPRLKEYYFKTVVAEMMKKYGFTNIYQVPRLDKVVVNVGISEAKENPKVVDIVQSELGIITGQKPLICRAKKSISNFKLRKGVIIGMKVTLRGNIMYEFLDRFISTALPRIRDFSGLNPNGFDDQGNFNLGLNEQYIFPEIEVDKSDKARGMNITLKIISGSKAESRDMLGMLGMPFKKDKKEI